MKGLLLIISLLLIIVGGIYFYKSKNVARDSNQSSSQEQRQPEKKSEPQTDQAKSNVKTYSMEEVAQHGSDQNNYKDCWTVINGKVYDITKYVDSMQHPGGEQIYQACGKDATALFENRPGIGTPHPQSAIDILGKYYIGDLRK